MSVSQCCYDVADETFRNWINIMDSFLKWNTKLNRTNFYTTISREINQALQSDELHDGENFMSINLNDYFKPNSPNSNRFKFNLKFATLEQFEKIIINNTNLKEHCIISNEDDELHQDEVFHYNTQLESNYYNYAELVGRRLDDYCERLQYFDDDERNEVISC